MLKHKCIDILYLIRYMDADVAASEDVSIVHPENMSTSKRWTNAQIGEYRGFVNDVIDIVTLYYDVTVKYQSEESYSYYITFIDDEIEYEIKIRLSDHYQQVSDKATKRQNKLTSKSHKLIPYKIDIVVGKDKQLKTYMEAIEELGNIMYGIYTRNPVYLNKDYVRFR